jgi:peptidoglycan/LPS O-acetylase OafA/YrhL
MAVLTAQHRTSTEAEARQRSAPRYRPELDGLRALAIGAVVLFHYLPAPFRGGYLGVTLFFVLSGYLITSLLTHEHEETGTIDRRAFYTRRALRLWPALIVVVPILLALALTVGHAAHLVHALLVGAAASLVHLNDFVVAADRHLATDWFGATWSLGVEEQFYLVWPLVLLFALRRTSRKRLALACAATALIFALAYPFLFNAVGARWLYYSPLGNIAPLMAGCALALYGRVHPHKVVWLAALAIFLALTFVAKEATIYPSAWKGPVQLATLASVVLIGAIPAGGAIASASAVWLGKRSYSLYLTHAGPWQVFATRLASSPAGIVALIGIPVSLLWADASYRLVERPFLKLKGRFERGRRPGVGA